MTIEEIEKYLRALNDELISMGVKGEICLYGGAVMCLVYQARPSTKDVDAIFQPADKLREAAARVAKTHGLRADWLNDAVKGFVVEHPQRVIFDLPALKVYVPEPDYLLAMKTLASRVDSSDKEDILFLINLLNLKTAGEVFVILEKYYPQHQIKPATQFFVEELFEHIVPSE
ncbi:MAG: DUF6036 family nucleotidyltransferase [Acidobacteria bacterium]|nr:DUF6036 family nucleotidyltransferase [Acidobacteriota bacterium]